MTMTRIAIEGVPGFEADSREIDRAGPTYTIDTVESFPEDEELFLILGADAAMGIPTWHRANELVERVTLLIVPRAGTDSTNVARLLPRSVFLDMAVLEVSGTEIRLLAGSGHPFRFLLTSAVHGYIKKQGLYTETRRDDMVGGHMETEQS
jgi:nicotinate-nucleotide adenylyltransferase